MRKRTDLSDFFKIPIPVQKNRPGFDSYACDAAVDGAAYGYAGSSEIEIYPGGVSPGFLSCFEVILGREILIKESPFPLIFCALKQFELNKAV